MDSVAAYGAAAFGSRLRRLVERLDREVTEIYRAAGVDFEPRWYGVFRLLADQGPSSVGKLAASLGVTHAAVSQVRAALENADLIACRADPADGRRQQLRLTDKGEVQAARLRPLWSQVERATRELLEEGAPQLLGQLTGLESAMERRGLKTRLEIDVET